MTDTAEPTSGDSADRETPVPDRRTTHGSDQGLRPGEFGYESPAHALSARPPETSNERAKFRSFEESTAEDWAIIAPRLAVTQGMVADRVINLMRDLEQDHGGFPVDRLEHSLQTATRAERDGRDDEYVLCALLHDIGDTLSPYNHPEIAAAILKPFVSEANHFMVQRHGEFQGYYFWHHLGMDRNARDKWADSPYFDRTAEFCAEYDQTAFDPDYRSNPLEHYEPLIREILRST